MSDYQFIKEFTNITVASICKKLDIRSFNDTSSGLNNFPIRLIVTRWYTTWHHNVPDKLKDVHTLERKSNHQHIHWKISNQ